MMSNKDSAISFLRMVVGGEIRAAYDKYIAADFKHHNIYYPGDRQSLMVGMEENEVKFPNKLFDVKQVIEEGDKVMTFSHVKLSDEINIAVMHLFLFKNGKVIELWDMGQLIPKDTPNKNGVF